jgi:UDP-GlcNAc3NAcA epimerase
LKTILHIVGNRPQFVKLAVLYAALSKDKNIQQKIVHTGQHFSYEMSDIFFAELKIPLPTINFNIQNSSVHLFIGEAADALYKYFLAEKNSIVFVYGDTNTTLAAAMAAKKAVLPLIHFEAGVRTYDNSMPEEINRILTDRIANVNYCCTQHNLDTMLQEGYGKIIPTEVLLTGDLMLDAFMKIQASNKKIITHNEYVVCTIHREANLSSKENLQQIFNALNKINNDIPVVLPLHPHTHKRMQEYGIQANFTTLPPLGYPDMKSLLSLSKYVITDSGGTSREAYFLRKKSLILMDTPFWPEILEQKCSLNTSANELELIEKFNTLDVLQSNFDTNIFGDGNAAEKIHAHLIDYIHNLK